MSDIESSSICSEDLNSIEKNDNQINQKDGVNDDCSASSEQVHSDLPSQSNENNISDFVYLPSEGTSVLSGIESDSLTVPCVSPMESEKGIAITTDNNADLRDINEKTGSCDSTETSHPNELDSAPLPEISGDSNGDASREKKKDGAVLVEVKEEPFSLEYEKASYFYRGPIVVYSSSDEDSSDSDSSAPCPRIASEPEVISDDEEDQKQNSDLLTTKSIIRTRGEVFPEELPPFDYLTISPGEEVSLEPLGCITGIVGVLVVIKANEHTPALYDDTVLFSESRTPLGLIFEVFGTVEQPYYTIRFNNTADIKEKDISIGETILYAPKADNLTKYVFIKELESMRYDDASWEHDNETPAEHRDYSDDEEERRVKAKKKNSRRGQSSMSEKEAPKKPKRNVRQDLNSQSNDNTGHPGLLKGDLTRNPFGNRPRPFKKPEFTQWPPPDNTGHPGLLKGDLTRNPFGNRPRHFKKPEITQWPPPGPRPNNNNERPPWFSSPPPVASFGECPNWEQQNSRFQSPSFVNRFTRPPPQAAPILSSQTGPPGPRCAPGSLFSHGPPGPARPPSPMRGLSGPPNPIRQPCPPGQFNPSGPRVPTDMAGNFRGPPPFQSSCPPRPGHFPPMSNQETCGRGMFNPSLPPPSFRSLFNPPRPPR